MNAARSASSANRFKAAAGSRRKNETTGQTPERGATARRTKPVRITIDLAPEDYRRMRHLVDELAARTDTPTLAHSVMWRAMLRIADTDPQLLEAIARRIQADQD